MLNIFLNMFKGNIAIKCCRSNTLVTAYTHNLHELHYFPHFFWLQYNLNIIKVNKILTFIRSDLVPIWYEWEYNWLLVLINKNYLFFDIKLYVLVGSG